MGKFSTLIYLFSNLDEDEMLLEDLKEFNLTEFEHIFKFIETNTKKIPDRMVNNVIDFAKNYS